jgi:hypothetical protein
MTDFIVGFLEDAGAFGIPFVLVFAVLGCFVLGYMRHRLTGRPACGRQRRIC